MTQHTPEPWKVSPQEDSPYEDIVLSAGTHKIAKLWLDDAPVHDYNAEQRANARRIVACVNALANVDTELLEEVGAHFGDTYNEEFAHGLAVAKQRDELLAALEDAATSLETIQLRSFGEDSFLDSKPEMRSYAGSRAAVAREAIGKAKDGTEIIARQK